MGFLKGLTEKVFGGTDNSAQKAQMQANARAQAWIEEQARLARGDANYLYTQGDFARNAGLNAAMALLGNAMPQQMGLYQNGNVYAQQQLLAGLPQYQAAILGMPVNNQALQPYRAQMPDASAYQQRLPDFGMPRPPQAGQSWGAPQMQAQVMPVSVPLQQGNPANQEAANRAIAMMLGGRYV